jgi:hypothetical protein
MANFRSPFHNQNRTVLPVFCSFDNYFGVWRFQNLREFRNLERVRVEEVEGLRVEDKGEIEEGKDKKKSEADKTPGLKKNGLANGRHQRRRGAPSAAYRCSARLPKRCQAVASFTEALERSKP